MKKDVFVSLLIIILAAFSCSTQNQGYFEEGDVIISGEITGWVENRDVNTIRVIINDLASGNQTSLVELIQSDGTFNFAFNKYNYQDIWLEYGNAMKTLFVQPGDSIFICFSANGFSNSDSFSADGAKANLDIQAFFEQFNSLQWDDIRTKMSGLTPLDYKALVYEQQVLYDSLLSSFVIETKPEAEIEKWISNYMKYRCAFDMINYISTGNEIPEEYWEFFTDYPVDNENAVICSKYYAYLEMYHTYLGLVEGKLDEIMKLYSEGEFYQLLNTYADIIASTTTGSAFEIMLTQFCYVIAGKDLSAVDSFYIKYDDLVQNTVLKNQLYKEITQLGIACRSTNLASKTNIFDLQKNGSLGDLFKYITKNYLGNILYIDFWATWCSPCMEELPYSNILHKEYEDEPVVFIYLCSRSSTAKWKAVIEARDIEGEHFHLSNDQYRILQSEFQIQGMPHYLLVNSNGDIIETDAPRPSTEEIRVLLNNLLGLGTP